MSLSDCWNCFDTVMRSIHQTGSSTGVQVHDKYSRKPSREKSLSFPYLTARLATVCLHLIECDLNGDA